MEHRTYIICIGGFQQGIGERSGLFRLWMKLSRLRGPNTSVDLYKWDTRWSDVAEQIWLTSEDWENPRIVVLCYSYGGGWGLIQLARQLGRRGLDIETVVASDAVYRSKWLIGKWLAFVDWPVIKIPQNVKHVHWFYQRTDRPRGHKIVAVNTAATKIEAGIEIHASHLYADESPVFLRLSQQVAEEAVRETAIEEAVNKQQVAQQEIQQEIDKP